MALVGKESSLPIQETQVIQVKAWVPKILRRRAWQPTPSMPACKESHGQNMLAGYSLWDWKRVRHPLATEQQLSPCIGQETGKVLICICANKPALV